MNIVSVKLYNWIVIQKWLRRFVRNFKFVNIINTFLSSFPITRQKRNINYRITKLSSFFSAIDILILESVYKKDYLLKQEINTFIDLGCNVGYFTLWLAGITQNKNLRGLMIDANPELTQEVLTHITNNNLSKVHFVYGLAGKELNFNIIPGYGLTSINENMSEEQAEEYRGNWKTIKPPSIDLSSVWKNRFNTEEDIDFLKMDIEGAEVDVLKKEKEFLKRVKIAFIKWHHTTSCEEIELLAKDIGWELVKIIVNNRRSGSLLFRRK